MKNTIEPINLSSLSGLIKSAIFAWLALLLAFPGVSSERSGDVIITGRLLNRDGMPIVHATIYSGTIEATSGEDGKFKMRVPTETSYLQINSVGYISRRIVLPEIPLPPFLDLGDILFTESNTALSELVVTATRTQKLREDLPLPVTVIKGEDIRARGLVRLNEVLAEETGIVLHQNHGTGLQLQGFDAKHTLILINGEPVIGRSSGTLDLSRITLRNVERIEVIKGPASSLYGSEAMAGVVNIITREPVRGRSADLSARYGTNHAVDLTAGANFRNDRVGVNVLYNRFSNQGYTYGKEGESQTVAPFTGNTGSIRMRYRMSSKTNIALSTRYFGESSRDRYTLNISGSAPEVPGQPVVSQATRIDFSLLPDISHRFSDRHESQLRLNHTRFRTDTKIWFENNGALHNHDSFNQHFSRAEFQHNYSPDSSFTLTAGGGSQEESVAAVRYENMNAFRLHYAFLQSDWSPNARWNVVAGGRVDVHNVYKSQISPKLAARYTVNPKLSLHTSLGRGFKAPDFRELYLNWTNPTQGYSVFGFEEVMHRMAILTASGEIAELLTNSQHLSERLDAERSWSYQAGARIKPVNNLQISLNFFKNDIDNLIATLPIALKTNGKTVYTYTNQEKVSIEGLDASMDWKPGVVALSGGFQYLHAVDRAVVAALREGRTYYTREPSTGKSRLVKPHEYGGLLNRSTWTANLKLSYRHAPTGIEITARWIYRNRFGIRDTDGNGILNLKEEYAPGYSLFNTSIARRFIRDRLTIMLSADNLGNIRQTGIATMPGRLLHLSMAGDLSW